MLKSFAGGRVFGASWGSGAATVVALHGWQRTHRDFSAVFEDPAFAGAHAAIGLDLFGFGATPPPPEPWGTEEYARHLLPLFDGADGLAERVTIVGHSFGGRVAVRLAAMAPDRIERLVLTGVPLLDRADRRATPSLSYRVARRIQDGSALRPGERRHGMLEGVTTGHGQVGRLGRRWVLWFHRTRGYR